ncbi:MAG TPA: pseudouridine synthase [bacterium]|nr:pseudouridine synthase [bacterium]
MEKINLTKLITERSHHSRRQAEILIREGLIKVNGLIAKLGDKVENDCELEINNKKIENKQDKKIYLKLNKPIGYTCTNKSFPGEKNIFSLIPLGEKLFSVGRLDKDSCGLIILTNDGDLNYQLTHPKFEHHKIYLIKLYFDRRLEDPAFIREIIRYFKNGIDIEERTLAKAKNIEYLGANDFKIILAEGKKRQLRRMFAFFNLNIKELKRVDFAGIKLESLKDGEWKFLTPGEIKLLKE